ncbi:hypothetical protein B296_00029920 [Ensete ventricosum]|uniref:Uncharacterized protein n=1 Tax=Ensete ventricosum TaxID=4639 RepID=A0A426YAI4_ENSVE|nr:hypothetical protein B296_00029920 [Ensete ventricosum]
MRKISFKLHMMRLNHVELFYALSLCFRNKGRVVGYGQGPCRGGRTWLGRRGSRPRPTCKGRRSPMTRPQGQYSPVASPQGATLAHCQATEAEPVEGQRPQRCRLRAWCPPACEVSPEGSGAYRRGDR